MRVLWLCGLPKIVQESALGGGDYGAFADWSWIVAHLPPPPEVELHIGCLWPGKNQRRSVEFRGARFHLLPCPKRGRALLLFSRDRQYFQALFDELEPAVVHGWGTEDSFGLVARQLAPTRHVVGIQGLITEYRKRIRMPLRSLLTQHTEKRTLRSAQFVVAESTYSLQVARPLCGRASMRVIEHPVREEFLQQRAAGVSQNGILFLGRIDARKGIFDAVRSFAGAADSAWTFNVVGSGDEKEERTLSQLVNQLGLGDRFQHSRRLSADQIVQLMRQCSVFLLPTRVDTGPTALKEALAMGLWPVCYDNSGPAEYTRLFHFGTLAKDGDVRDLTEKLAVTLRDRAWENEATRSELKERTRQRFCRHEIWKGLIQLYEEVSGSDV